MSNPLKDIFSPEARIFRQSYSMNSHPGAGLMLQQPVPLSFIRLSRYDVSVSDIVMTGPLSKIAESLHDISLKSQSIYTTKKHKTIKVWFNRRDREFENASLYPMAEAVINNTAFLTIRGVGLGLGTTVVDLIHSAGINNGDFRFGLEQILNMEFKNSALKSAVLELSLYDVFNKPVNFLFEMVWNKHLKSSHSSPLRSVPQGKAAFYTLVSLIHKHVKPLVKPGSMDEGVDFKISNLPYNMPKEWKSVSQKSLFARIKAMASLLTAEDYIIRVGSCFNKHHAGFVIDLDTHNIDISELVYFLSYYKENEKLVNCFQTAGLDVII